MKYLYNTLEKVSGVALLVGLISLVMALGIWMQEVEAHENGHLVKAIASGRDTTHRWIDNMPRYQIDGCYTIKGLLDIRTHWLCARLDMQTGEIVNVEVSFE